MKVLFANEANGHAYENPYVTLVAITGFVSADELRKYELKQPGVLRRGGDWQQILDDMKQNFVIQDYTVISHGRFKDYEHDQFNMWYRLISGNY